MAEAESLITEEMRASIGREGPPSKLELDKTGIRMFARSVGHVDPIFYDEEYAKSKGKRSIVAPPGYLGTAAFRPGGGERGPGGMPARAAGQRGGRVLNGGTEFEYTGIDICAGDTLTSVGKTVSINEAPSGSLGAKMLITRRQTTYTNQNGEVVCRSYGTTLQY